MGSSPNPKVIVQVWDCDRRLYLWELLESESSLVGIERGSKVIVGTVTRLVGGADATGKLIELNLHASKPIPRATKDNNAMPEFIKL